MNNFLLFCKSRTPLCLTFGVLVLAWITLVLSFVPDFAVLYYFLLGFVFLLLLFMLVERNLLVGTITLRGTGDKTYDQITILVGGREFNLEKVCLPTQLKIYFWRRGIYTVEISVDGAADDKKKTYCLNFYDDAYDETIITLEHTT